MEVFSEGAWGTVCDDYWDLKDARVVCRYLGFADALNGTSSGTVFDEGSGRVIMSNVRCSGNEANVLNCPHAGIGSHSCNHSQDAGVICTGKAETYQIGTAC